MYRHIHTYIHTYYMHKYHYMYTLMDICHKNNQKAIGLKLRICIGEVT